MLPDALLPLWNRAHSAPSGDDPTGEWRTPRVLRGAIDTAHWSEDHLRERYGALKVTAKIIASPDDWFRPRQDFVTMRLDEALDAWSPARANAWPRCYVTTALDALPTLATEVAVPAKVRAMQRDDETLKRQWFLGRDGISKCHYHSDARAMLGQMLGAKHVLLFPPGDTRWLSPLPWYDVEHCWSGVNFLRPERSPALARTTPSWCSLSPGDALFIPTGWWHVVFGEGLSGSITSFWSAPHAPWRYSPDAPTALRDALEWTVRRPLRRVQTRLGASLVRARER